MSNDTFESLYKQFSLMIKSFIRKYNGLLEEEDIRQCCCLGIVNAYKTYKDNRNTKFSNWVYNNMNWECLRQLRGIKHQDRDCISLHAPLNSSEDDNMTLEDTLQDDIDIQEEVQSKIMINYYEAECKRVLPEDKFQVCYLRWFENYSYKAIEKVTEIKNISGVLLQSQSLLLAKSRVFNEEYKKLVGISEYNTERIALI